VLSTLVGAIDRGFRVILITDALCSSTDETHDAMINVYMNRFGEQVETVTTQGWAGESADAVTSSPSSHLMILL